MRKSMRPQSSLLEQLGGAEVVEGIVGAWYFYVLRDERIAQFFKTAPMERILLHQRQFLAVALGGELAYDGPSLSRAHQRLIQEQGLCAAHFDMVHESLARALSDFQVDAQVAGRVLTVVGATKHLIF